MSLISVSSGKLIEYLDNGKFICGYVTDSQPKRVRLLNQNGRELNLPISRIVHCSSSRHNTESDRESLIRTLRSTTEKRHLLMERVDLEMLWELTCEENTDSFDPHFLAELTFGQDADDDIVSALLRSVFKDKLFFKYREGKIKVHSPEKVEQLKFQLEKEAQKEEIIHNGADLLNKLANADGSQASLSETEEEIISILQEYYLHGSEAQQADVARKILTDSGFRKPHDIYIIFTQSGVWKQNVNIPLLRANLPTSFSTEARQRAEAILQCGNQSLFDDPARQDLTHLSPLTIDGATTLDFDDALTVEQQDDNYLVGIHISDVAHYVRPGDPLFQEAMNRGTSLYFPEGQVPMLPRHLSQGVCSLIQGETRAAYSHMILLSPEGEVLKVRIIPSIIRVARRLTYEDADRMIQNDPELMILDKLRKKLRDRRLQGGALLLPFPDVNIHIDNSGRINVSLGKTDTAARTIISEMMILANTEAARFVADRMAPGLFRSQGKISKRVVHGDDDDLFLNSVQRKNLPRSELSTEAKIHSGLGVSFYTTVTSPIRRLLDLVMQHQINNLVRRKNLCFTQEMCKDFTSVITRILSTANNVKQQRHRYWLLKYLEERKNSYMDALVIESGPKRVNLVLTDILMDIDLPATRTPRPEPGTLIQVRPVKVDALDNNVRFDW